MGTIDANGIWRYDNTDHMVPHATYSNMLAISVSDALADLRADLTPINTPWTNVTSFATSVVSTAGYPVAVKREGDIVMMKGRLHRNSGSWASGIITLCTLPTIAGAPLLPDTIRELGPAMYGTSSSTGRLFVTTTGILQGSGLDTIGTGDIYISHCMYPL